METEKLIEDTRNNQVQKEDDGETSQGDLLRLAFSYRIVENMQKRFSDKFQKLARFYEIFLLKEENFDFKNLAQMCGTVEDDMASEYKIYRRYPGGLCSQKALLTLACVLQKKVMFPAPSAAAMKVLFLPVGTAVVERTFLP